MVRRKVQESWVGSTRVELYHPGRPSPESFADGVHGFTLEDGNVKMDLYVLDPTSDRSCQRRDLVGRLVIPVERFAQFARSVNHLGTQVTAMEKGRAAATGS